MVRLLMSETAKERGARRSNEFRLRVENAMALIEKEMAENEGIYPHNKGSINLAEISRRAGVHQTTFHSPIQREYGDTVKAWVNELKKRKFVGVGPVRRALSERIADWRAKYEGLAQSHRDTELLLQATEAELESVRTKLDLISSENAELKKSMSVGRIVQFFPKDS